MQHIVITKQEYKTCKNFHTKKACHFTTTNCYKRVSNYEREAQLYAILFCFFFLCCNYDFRTTDRCSYLLCTSGDGLFFTKYVNLSQTPWREFTNRFSSTEYLSLIHKSNLWMSGLIVASTWAVFFCSSSSVTTGCYSVLYEMFIALEG